MAVVQPASVCLQPADGGFFPLANATYYGVAHLQDTSCWQHVGSQAPYTLSCELPSAEILPGQAPALTVRLPPAGEVHAPTSTTLSTEREGSWRATASPQHSEALSWLSGWAKLAAVHNPPPSEGGCATPPQRAQHPSLSTVWGDSGSLTHSGHSSPEPVAPAANSMPRKRRAAPGLTGDASPWPSARSAASAPPSSAPHRRTRARRSLDLAPAAARDPGGDAVSVSSLPAMRLSALPAGSAAQHLMWPQRGSAGAGSVRPAPSPPLPLELSLGPFGADDWEALDAALAALNDAPSPLLPQLASCPDWL